MYLKFAENIDMLVHIVNAQFKNERGKDNGCTGCKTVRIFFVRKRFRMVSWCHLVYD